MLSIQDVGLSILGDTPKNFYILGGSEYGIKDKYIEILTDKLGPKLEYESMLGLVKMLSKRHIVPLQPQLYVIRYDKEFVSSITKELANKILRLHIPGGIVLIYEDDKDLNKLDKFFPSNTASIDAIDIKPMTKHLRQDFPNLDKDTIGYAAKHAVNYYQAKSICRCLDAVQDKFLLTEKQILTVFDMHLSYSQDDIQAAIASRNFNAIMYIIDHYDGDPQGLLYQMLRVMVELDKCKNGKYTKSPLKPYAKEWTDADIYNMFCHVYETIKQLRTGYTAEVDDLLIYLSSLMMFKTVPNLAVMS